MPETQERRGLTRRAFLKTTAAVAGTAAIATSIGCTAGGAGGGEGGGAAVADEVKTFANWCRGNCAGGAQHCCLETKVREGKVVSTRQRPLKTSDVSVQPGCVKGPTNPQRIYGPARLLYPMLQTGERGSDNWERISWDEALSMIAEKMQAAFKDYGPTSVGFLNSYSGNSGELSSVFGTLFNFPENRTPCGIGPERFLRKTGITIFTPPADLALLHMQYTVLAMVGNSPEDAVNAKNIFFFCNPCDATREAWSSYLDAKQKGAKLIAVDPRFSNTAAHSDQWVPIRPATDGALYLAMCNYIIDNDLIDYDYFRNKSVAPLLVNEEGTYLRLSDLGLPLFKRNNPYTGQEEELDTEVVVDSATGAFGSSFEIKDPTITGTFDANGVSVRTVYDLVRAAIAPYTVEFAVKECGLTAETIEGLARTYVDGPSFVVLGCGPQHFQNSWRMYYGLLLMASLSGNAQKPGACYSCGGNLATPIFKLPTLDKTGVLAVDDAKICNTISLNRVPELVETGKWLGQDHPLRLLWIAGSHALGSGIGYTAQIEAWKKIDFVVVASEYMTDTAKQASLALPVTMPFEQVDFTYGFMNQKAIEPIGESKSDFEIFVALAGAMGYDDLYDKDAEGYLRELLDTEVNKAAGLGYDDYQEKGMIYVDEIKRVETVGVEYNATGRTQFFVESLVTNGNWEVQTTLQDRLPSYEHAYEAYADNPLRSDYPLFGISYHDNYTGQCMHHNVAWLNEIRGYKGEPYTFIHEKAAAERGIVTGDNIRIFNDRGSFVTRAVVTKGIQEETINIPRGYEASEMQSGHLQSVTSIDARDRITNNDSHNDWLCQVEKV